MFYSLVAKQGTEGSLFVVLMSKEIGLHALFVSYSCI